MNSDENEHNFQKLQQENALLRQQIKEFQHLASIPQQNTALIFEIDHNGQPVYINPAAQHTLSQLGMSDSSLFLPHDFDQISDRLRKLEVAKVLEEININGQVYEELFSYSPESDTILIHAHDITRQILTQESSRQSEARFRMALKDTPVSVAAQDINLRYIWAYNQQLFIHQDLIGKTDADLFSTETAAWLTQLKKQVLHTGKELKEQGWVNIGDRRLFLDIYLEPTRDDAGVITGVGITAVNLTDRKIAEQALFASEERYHSLFSSMTEGFALHEMLFDDTGKPCDYRFLDINPAFERLTGLKRELIIGKTYHEVLPGEGDRWVNYYGEVVLTGEPAQFEEFSPSLNRYYEIFTYRCAPNQFAVIFVDITRRKQMEEELRINYAKYSALFDSLPLGVTVSDQNGQIIESNEEAARLLGLSEEEQKQRTIESSQWKIIRPDGTIMPPEEYASVRALKEQQRVENIEMGVVKDSDEVTWISVTAAPLPIENSGVVITYNDITKRITAEEALRRAHEELELTVQKRTAELSKANQELRDEIHERKRIESELLLQTKAVEAGRKRFNDVLEILPAYLILLTSDYHVSFANRYFRERFGEDHGKRCYEYLFGRSEPCEICETYKVLKTNGPLNWEWTGPDEHNYDVFDFPFTDVDGTSLILEMGIDITDRKQAEHKLRQINEYNRSLLEANVDALVTITPDGIIRDVNSVTEAITGYTRDQLIGTAFHSFFTDPKKARAGYEQVFETGTVRDYELEIQHKNGHVTPVVYNASVYRDESGQVAGVFAAARDITERKLADTKLRQLNAYNRSLIDASLDALATITPDGKIGDVNSVTEAITGYRREELIGTDFHNYFTDPEKARSGYQRVFEYGTLHDYELEIQHRNGHTTPVTYNASVYCDETGRVSGVFAAARDITERKRAERQLILLTTALESAANGIILVDKDGAILWTNPAFNRMTGYSKDEVIGQNPRILRSGKQDQEFYRNLWDTILAGKVWRGEITNRRKDGSFYVEEQTITPVSDQDGEITNFISIRRDITEHKRAEEALRKSEEQYRSLVIATAQIVWQTDPQGRVIEDNPLWRNFTGQSFDELLGQGWLEAIHSADRERVSEVWMRSVETATPYETECRIKSRTGEYADFSVRGVPIIDKQGKVSGWIGTCTNITDKKNYENQLLQAEKHAAIGRMVGSVTHEINNPLQTIKNCIYLIQQDTPPDSPNAEPLEMALSETQRLSSIVGQLRQLYRPQTVQTMRSQDLLEIIEEVHTLVIPHMNNSMVTWRPSPGLKPCNVNCIRDQMIEVFLNIFMNAIEAMQPDGGVLAVNMIHSTDKAQVGVVISDTGPGISPEVLPHIFEPFMTTKEFGLGLGLSICYGIVQKHDGQITIDSQPGEGTSFTIWLPVIS